MQDNLHRPCQYHPYVYKNGKGYRQKIFLESWDEPAEDEDAV